MRAHRAAQDLARAGLRQPRPRRGRRGSTATAPMLVAHELPRARRARSPVVARRRRPSAPRSPSGTSPRSSSGTPITAHSATSGCVASDLLHRAGREPVAGDVDDVVDAAHHEQVAVLVDVAAVAGHVVAGERASGTTSTKRSSSSQSVGSAPGGSGRRMAMAPVSPAAASSPVRRQDPHVVAGHRPGGRARLDRQRLDAAGSSRRSASPSRSATSGRSPARRAGRAAQCVGVRVGALAGEEQRRRRERSWPRSSAPSGSSFLIARNAVGAVNSVCTPCSATTRQNAPASGVPTGLPS